MGEETKVTGSQFDKEETRVSGLPQGYKAETQVTGPCYKKDCLKVKSWRPMLLALVTNKTASRLQRLPVAAAWAAYPFPWVWVRVTVTVAVSGQPVTVTVSAAF